MLKIVASAPLKPDCKAQFLDLARPLIEASRAEDGNVSYDLTESMSDPNTVAFIEFWKDEDAIKFHNATPHFTATVPQFEAFFAAPMSVTIYRDLL